MNKKYIETENDKSSQSELLKKCSSDEVGMEGKQLYLMYLAFQMV